MKVLVDLPIDSAMAENGSILSLNTPNRIQYGVVQIARLPNPDKRIPGARKGDKIQAQVVLTYVGGLTVTLQEDAQPPKLIGSRSTKRTRNLRKRESKGRSRVAVRKRKHSKD